jgi:hypothetical protein
LEGKVIDWASFTQAINTLCGLLGRLGLERRVKQAGGVLEYVKEKHRNGNGKT